MSTTVELSVEQQEIREVARRMLDNEYPMERVRELMATDEGFTAEGWTEIAELGWTGIAVAEERGGAGYGDIERCVLLEEMGRSVLPGPYLSSAVLASDLLEAAGDGDEAAELLSSLLSGERRATVVAFGDLLGRLDGDPGVSASGDALDGDGGLVLDAGTADELLVVVAADDGVGLYAVAADADGVTRTAVPIVDETRKVAEVRFDGAQGRRIDGGSDCATAVRAALDRSTIALAAEQVGGAQQVLDTTLQYLRERKQFGVPIGSFQALKHRAADAGLAVDAARETVLYAADALLSAARADDVSRLTSAAKAAASDAYVLAASEAIQMHGGIGFTDEADAHLYYKRAVCGARMLGGATDHRERIVASLSL